MSQPPFRATVSNQAADHQNHGSADAPDDSSAGAMIRAKQASRYQLTRWLFLRALGVIYLIAFVSLSVQIIGLCGRQGIEPAAQWLTHVQSQIGSDCYWRVPTWLWLNCSDTAVVGTCYAGVLLALLVICNILPAPALLLSWAAYLSLCSVCHPFLNFQWDVLLLETGFLAIFLAPWQLRPRISCAPPPSMIVIWLLRWLLFRLMFMSGVVKLRADEVWRDLTALTYHYETQCLPPFTAWYVHHLPVWFHKLSAGGMFLIELVVPFAIFGPRLFRKAAFFLLVFLQVLIILTGNYTFFNYLTIVLCIPLVDDRFLERLLPRRFRPAATTTPGSLRRLWPRTVLRCLLAAAIISTSTLLELGRTFPSNRLVQAALPAISWIRPFRSINTYGLFANMTVHRPEILVEGSNDGRIWKTYEFKWKPGDLARRPRFVAPHQPRLDWQMWFAALGSYRSNPWFVHFVQRLLEGSPAVLDLLEYNPFPDKPPTYIRAELYDYHFTTSDQRRQTGNWWTRQRQRSYLPRLSLRRP